MELDFSKLKDYRFEERLIDIHLYADYAELLCLKCEDHLLTRDIYLRWLIKSDFFSTTEGRSVDTAEPLPDNEASSFSESMLNLSEEEEQLDDRPEDQDDFLTRRVKPVEGDSRREAFINDIFEHLHARFLVMNSDDYPFKVDDAASTLTLKENLTSGQVLYVFLLLSSHLGVFKKNQPMLTALFERISFAVFKRLLPPTAETHMFGAGENASARYKGTTYAKLKTLAADLKAKFQISETELSGKSAGDHGIDLVGWIDIADPANGRIVLFGQCACGKGWKKKQSEVAVIRWDSKLGMSSKHTPVVHIPYFFRQANIDWHEPSEIHSLLIDRLRVFLMATDDDIAELVTDPMKKACTDAISKSDIIL